MEDRRRGRPKSRGELVEYLRSYALAEGVVPLRDLPWRKCKRLVKGAPDTATDTPVAIDRTAVVRAVEKYTRELWSVRDLDEWVQFVRLGFHPSQVQEATS